MDIKRKKITNEEIYAAEQKRAAEIRGVCEAHRPSFSELGYELDLTFGQKEHEAQNRFEAFSEEQKPYDSGYLSRALVTVKRFKTEAELQAENAIVEENKMLLENANAEEAEQLENDETLRASDSELKRSVAFTEIMLVRVYKSFWVEYVNIGDDMSDLENDLAEFLSVLKAKKEASENP